MLRTLGLLPVVFAFGCSIATDTAEIREIYEGRQTDGGVDAGPTGDAEVVIEVATPDLTAGVDYTSIHVAVAGAEETIPSIEWLATTLGGDAAVRLDQTFPLDETPITGVLTLLNDDDVVLAEREIAFQVSENPFRVKFSLYGECAPTTNCQEACLLLPTDRFQCVPAECSGGAVDEPGCDTCVSGASPEAPEEAAGSDYNASAALRTLETTSAAAENPWLRAIDLDATCSRAAAEATCVHPSGVQIDGPGGEDVVLTSMLAGLTSYPEVFADDAADNFPSQRFEQGENLTLIQLTGVGDPINDGSVTVELFRGTPTNAMTWAGGDTPSYVRGTRTVGTGFIRDGRLFVDQFSVFFDFWVPLPGDGRPPLVIKLEAMQLRGDLVYTGRQLMRIDNLIIGGRWDAGDAESELIRTVCTDDALIEAGVTALVQRNLDITRERDTLGQPCDALSVGFGASASPIEDLGAEERAESEPECTQVLVSD